MFTFECLNHRAKLILASWEASGFDLRDFYVREENGYTNILCKYDYLHYTAVELLALKNEIRTVIDRTIEPYFYSTEKGNNSYRYYQPDGSHKITLSTNDATQPFNWSQQIERYRVALLLQATG